MTEAPVWHLLGAGSLGSLIAARLVEAGFSVRALPRHHQGSLHRTIHFPDGLVRELEIPLAERNEPIEHLVLAVKGLDTLPALTPLLSRFVPGATLMSVQNGIGALQQVPLPGHVHVIHAITTDGAWRDGEHVTVAAVNETLLGDGSAEPPAWLAQLSRHWPGLHWRQDILFVQWRKLAVNAVINPLTALYDCPNGKLAEDPALRSEMEELAEEVDRVASCVFPDWPHDTLSRSVRVAQQTARNMSSMRADVRAGRTTEVDFINGHLVREAHRFGLRLRAHERIIAAINRG